MNARDRVLMQDMLAESRRVQSAMADKTRADLDEYILANAMRHAIVLIGESASQITEETRQAHPQIAWRNIIGMRNFIVHRYWRVDADILWQTIQHDVPALIEQLDAILEID